MQPKHRAPTHPGEILREDFLKPRDLSQIDAAAQMGISRNRLNELVQGKRGVTADTALRLATLLKTDAEIWMNLQAQYDLWHAARAQRKQAS